MARKVIRIIILVWFVSLVLMVLISSLNMLLSTAPSAESRVIYTLVVKDVLVPLMNGFLAAVVAYAFANAVAASKGSQGQSNVDLI